MEGKILTFGEIMLRLQPPAYDRIRQAKSFEIAYGGGEANVAVCLAQLGDDAEIFTRLPDNEVGAACKNELRKFGVGVGKISTGGERLGIYFCEKGFGNRPSRVTYDRKGSAFSEIDCSELDFEELLRGVRLLHFTGITPALSDKTRVFTRRVLEEAKARGVEVFCDLNFRAKLWSSEEACRTMSDLMRYIDVLIANEEDAEKVFGIRAAASDVESGELDAEGYAEAARQIESRFGTKTVAYTLRESFSACKNGWSAILYRNGKLCRSRRYEMEILDRVGGGDAFAAGLIHALKNDFADSEAIEYAAACGALKHSVNGDFHIVSDGEIRQLLAGGGNGRVQR